MLSLRSLSCCVLSSVQKFEVLSAGMKAFVELLILLMSLLSLFWNLLLTFLNFTLCTMSRRSASNLSNSLFCGGHFLDLKPKLLLVTTSLLSSSLRSKKNAFHLIRLMTLSTFLIRLLRWFETVFHFPLHLNFMKGLFVCSKRLLLLVDSRCYNNLSTYQLLYSH